MADFSGIAPAVEVAPLLWALPLVPSAGALLAARAARMEEEPEGGTGWLAPASVWLALLAALPLVYRLARLDGSGRLLVAPGPLLFRAGTIDLHLGLSFDPTGALLALTLLLIASLGQLALATSPLPLRRQLTLAAFAAAATAAALLALLASCPLMAALGSGALTLLGLLAIRAHHEEAPLGASPLAGEILLWTAAAILTWGQTGSWASGELVLAPRPAVVPVIREAANATRPASSGASLTLGSLPGARVFLDNNAQPLAEAPFARVPVPSGPHTITVDPGHGMNIVDIRNFRIPEGAEISLLRADGAADPHGSQALFALRNDKELVVLRSRLAEGRLLGAPVATWAAGLLLLGLTLKALPLRAGATARRPRALALLVPQVGSLLVVTHLGARWLPLLGVLGGWPTWPAWAAMGAAAWMALVSFRETQPGRALGLGGAAAVVSSLAAASAGATTASVLLGVTLSSAAGLGLWILAQLEPSGRPFELASFQGTASTTEARWLKLSYAALIGLLPVGFGFLEALRVPGRSALLHLPLAALLGASIGRVVYAVTEGERPLPMPPKNQRRDEEEPDDVIIDPSLAGLPARLTLVLGAWLVLVGPLGASALYEAPLASWLTSTPALRASVPAVTALMVLQWVLLTGAGLLGARWSRVRYGTGRPERWQEAEATQAPQRAVGLVIDTLGGWATQGARQVARFGARLSGPFNG
jgi:hypothetical protein